MKLDKKRTFLVGFAFLAIMAFWQMYDAVIPKILVNTFNVSETITGFIMAVDNILAFFLMPIFGRLSDNCNTKIGKRKPFIIFGMLSTIILMVWLPLIANSYNDAHSTAKIILFIGILAVLLIIMSFYRSPAVALMPDVTPKPLRSKANAIINLMGAVGGVIYLGFSMILYPGKIETHVNYLTIFLIIMGVMFISLIVVTFFINEPRLSKLQQEYEKEHPEEDLSVQNKNNKSVMPKPVKISLIFLLLSVAFWYIAYNGISTWFTILAERAWGMEIGGASKLIMVASIAAIATYIPAGMLASKIGRKKTIIAGVLLLTSSFLAGFIYTLFVNKIHFTIYLLFALVGVAWATINVNSFPMVVEMCHGSDIGKFTGLYYMFSMTAQIITPIIGGSILEFVGYKMIFLYSAIFAFISFVTMCFVRHGDAKIERKKGLEAFDVD